MLHAEAGGLLRANQAYAVNCKHLEHQWLRRAVWEEAEIITRARRRICESRARAPGLLESTMIPAREREGLLAG